MDTIENANPNVAQRDAAGRYKTDREQAAPREADKEAQQVREVAAAESEETNWELPEGTTRATLADGSTVYTLPDGSQRHAHNGQPNRYIFKPAVDAVDKLTVKEIADRIRDEVDPHYAAKIHPDDQHLHATAVEVTKELGMEPNAMNVNHVSGLINQHVTAPSREFPKMKYHHGTPEDGLPSHLWKDKPLEIIVENAKEEADLGEGWVDTHWLAPVDPAAA